MAFRMPNVNEVSNTLKASLAEPEILTLYEAAKLLQVSEKTLAQQAQAGQLPHCRIGKQYRFVRSELLEWARSRSVSN